MVAGKAFFPMITVLFVDDEPALLDVSRLYLEKTGDIKVDTCYSAEQALECLKSRTYDTIVSDYEMPGMNGISLLKTVRKIGIETPFIIFTGRGREQIVIEALNSGADFYLQKGGDPRSQFAELVHKIRLAVERSRRERALAITRYAVEKAGVPVFWFDSRGRVLYANASGCAHLGYSIQELCLLHISDLDPFFSVQEWSQFVDRLKSHEKMTLHLIMKTKGGQDMPLPFSFSWGEFGGKTIIFAFSSPRTGKEWNEIWKKGLSSYQILLADAIPLIYMEISPSGEFLFQNSAARAFFGHCNPIETRTRCTIFDFTVKGQHKSLAELLSRFRMANEEELGELSLVRHDGKTCTFLFKTGLCPDPRGFKRTYFIEIPSEAIGKNSHSP